MRVRRRTRTRTRTRTPARTRAVLLSPLLAPLLVLASGPSATASSAAPKTAPAKNTSASTSASPGCGKQFRLDRDDFPAWPKVRNKWFPLVPGTQWTLRGSVAGSTHEVVTTVTDLTKVIDGVRTVVVLDEDFDGSDLQEAELAFFAQDEDGTVWALGEYPEEYDGGTLTGAPATWIVGVQHATTGIAMRRKPTVGTPAYRQGFSPKIGFDDCGVVFKTGASTCVQVGCYSNVLITDEWAPNAPGDGHQRKFYAQGVGLVRVEPVGGVDPEILVLSKVTHLGSSSLAKVHKQALKMDARGYTVSPKVYGHTPHAR
jgi:hypothetical protein